LQLQLEQAQAQQQLKHRPPLAALPTWSCLQGPLQALPFVAAVAAVVVATFFSPPSWPTWPPFSRRLSFFLLPSKTTRHTNECMLYVLDPLHITCTALHTTPLFTMISSGFFQALSFVFY
jgi:hypothetical protein